MRIELGKKYRDEVTGFTGTATARFEYLNGCVRYQLDAPSSKEDGIQELVFDEQRLLLADDGSQLSGRKRATGGPQRSAPPHRERAR